MEDILEKLHNAVELGKVDRKSPYPPQLRDHDGAYEITAMALDAGLGPQQILEEALIPAMAKVGKKFSDRQIFVPQMLLSAKAMGASMVLLKPFFASGALRSNGTFIIGTVRGDLHDIGKNLVSMMVEGGGWQVVDLGVDAGSDRFIETLVKHPGAVIGLSALLTTTMENMKQTVEDIRAVSPSTRILIGGAPVTQDFCDRIGADFYSPNGQEAVNYLNTLAGN